MANVILARYRNTEYTVRCEINGSEKRYTWQGSKGKRIDRKSVPQEVVDWLNMNTVCFDKGKLVIEGEKEQIEPIKEDIADRESYDNNTKTREDVEKMLNGHFKTLEKKLGEVTVEDEQRFIVDIAVELKDDLTGAKQTMISDWANIDKDILFD